MSNFVSRRLFLGALIAAATPSLPGATGRKIGWLGDSMTAGNYLPEAHRFANIVSKRFGCEAVNLGRDGAILDEVPADDPRLRACSLIVISHTGTNDAEKKVQPQRYGQRMREIMQSLAGTPLLLVIGATATDSKFHGKPPGWMRDRLEPYSRVATVVAGDLRVPVADAQAALQREIDAGRPDILVRRGDLRPAGWGELEWRLYLARHGDPLARNRTRVVDDGEDHLHRNDTDRRFFYNQHLNAHGNRVVAQAVIDGITSMPSALRFFQTDDPSGRR